MIYIKILWIFSAPVDRTLISELNFLMTNLTLYEPCIFLQYVYEPTRCTEFLWLDFIFHYMLYVFRTVLVHLQEQLYELYIALGICRYMPVPYVWLLCGYSHTTARRVVPAYTKYDVQLIKLLLLMD